MPADFEKKFKTGRNGELLLEKPGGGFEKVATVPDGSVAISATLSDQRIDQSIGGIAIPGGYYFGLVANRCSVPAAYAGANKQAMSRTRHLAMDRISAMRIVLSNWYVVGVESLPGGGANFKASLEYPAGTLAGTFTFDGAATGTAANGGDVVSDELVLPSTIPMGGIFFLRVWRDMPAGIVYSQSYSFNGASNGVTSPAGEWHVFGAAAADDTQNLTNRPNQQGVVLFKPTAILGWTNRPSRILLGDSRCGNGTNYDAVANSIGVVGEVERKVAKRFAVLNCGVAGEKMQDAAGTNAAKRIALSKYCSHAIVQYGINDFSAGRTGSQAITDLNTLAGKLGGMPVIPCTVSPKSSSTDSWATTANQTADATSNAQRIAYNNAVRAGLAAPLFGHIEIADQTESARNSGLWKVTGSANGYTADGLHGNANAMADIEYSNAFDALELLVR